MQHRENWLNARRGVAWRGFQPISAKTILRTCQTISASPGEKDNGRHGPPTRATRKVHDKRHATAGYSAAATRWPADTGPAFGWHWTRNGDGVASIQVRTEVDHVILNYRSRSSGGDWQPMEYAITLERTRCNVGGRRAWFLCPAQGCRRRVAILFGASIFACRHCHKLAHQCQREADERTTCDSAVGIRSACHYKLRRP